MQLSLRILLPLDLLCGLGHEEADHVCGDLVAPRVDGDLGVAALRHLRLDRQQQQLQLHKTQPEIDIKVIFKISSHFMFLDNFGCDKLIRFSAELLIMMGNFNVSIKIDNG